MTRNDTPSYGAYLRLNELLDCQEPPAFDGTEGRRGLAHHDEMLFIVVHQVFELWFRQILHDLSRARDLLGQPDVGESERRVPEVDIPRITGLLGRVNEILRVLVSQFTVLETMPSVHFLAFRDQLLPASGFQSIQFREFEILAGLDDDDRVESFGFDYEEGLRAEERARIDRRKGEMSLREAVFDWLSRTPVEHVFPSFAEAYLDAYRAYGRSQTELQTQNPNLTAAARADAIARIDSQSAQLQGYLHHADEKRCRGHRSFLFIASYREQPLLRWPYTLLEAVIEFEERLRLFRFRHARMVERMIGFRVGTGGSSGVAYLDQTAMRYRVFGSLLEGRSFLLSPALLPALPKPELLAFRGFRQGADEA